MRKTKKMKKSTTEQMKRIAVQALKTFASSLMSGIAFCITRENPQVSVTYTYEHPRVTHIDSTYGTAISAISNSDMCSFDKNIAIGCVDKCSNNEYYDAVIAIAKSTMCSSDKKSAIMNL